MTEAEEIAKTTAKAAEESAVSTSHRWFAVQTYTSFEHKVKQAIEHKVTLESLGDQIRKVIIPTETVIEIKGGSKRSVARTLMPGYVLVEMPPDENLFNLIKEIKGVSSFVGDGQSPVPLTNEEITNLLNIMEDKHEKPKPKKVFRKGDQIKVIEGPFTNFIGNVESMDETKGKLTVMVSIFGRPTPVELDVLQVEAT